MDTIFEHLEKILASVAAIGFAASEIVARTKSKSNSLHEIVVGWFKKR